MQLSELYQLFLTQCQINPVPPQDMGAALEYFLAHGYNIFDGYFTNPEDYQPQLHPRAANVLLDPNRQFIPVLGFVFNLDKALEFYLKTKGEYPHPSFELELDQLVYLLGSLGPSLLNESSRHIRSLLKFNEDEQPYADHLKEELIRCEGNITLIPVASEEDIKGYIPTQRPQEIEEIYLNLTVYRFLSRYVPTFDYHYWKLDQSALENINDCGISNRMMVKLTLTYLYQLGQRVTTPVHITKEMMEECLQWRNLSNLIDMNKYSDFIDDVFGVPHKSASLFRTCDPEVEQGSFPPLTIRSLIICALNKISITHTPSDLQRTFTGNIKLHNILDYLWLTKYSRWSDDYTRFPEEKFIVHHHDVIKEWSSDTKFDYSKHPRLYADVTIEHLRCEDKERAKVAVPYPVPAFVQYLDPAVMTHIPNYSELRWEGVTMHNCAGGYHNDCETGDSVFFHYHDGSQYGYTVELCPIEHGRTNAKKYIPSIDKDGDLVLYYLNEVNSFENDGATTEITHAVKRIFMTAAMKIEGMENAINTK